MPWSDPFDEPIPVRGRTLFTLECAARYIKKLSNAEQESQHWQLAIEQLIDAAEGRNFVMQARIGLLKALTRGHLRPEPPPPRKTVTKSYKVIR
jgi:hypothetical protein